ncbi:type II secretion system protein [Roseateles sp. LYH14W]|uniref:Type II secretion system protein n=1 Tax=Pelomonas parva TaxID=3299032 RepID=A0ABW7FA07_9BURK
MRSCGFTVIELLVVLAAMALLLSIAAPRYVDYLDNARIVALKQDLFQMREALDKFHADQGRYPKTLEELVERRYLRAIPEDPVTQRTDTWLPVAPKNGDTAVIADIRSGAPGMARDGTAYASW